MMFRFLVLLNFISSTLSYYIVSMNEEYQYETQILDLKSKEFNLDSYFGYGTWTRYAPLSGIAMIGGNSIFDTNCFNIHNAIDVMNREINFLYYDCVDEKENIIIKTIRFIDDQGNKHVFENFIEKNQYEFQWFYFQIIQWPNQYRLELIVLFVQTVIMEQVIEIQFPYKSKNIMLKFGGDLTIDVTQELNAGYKQIFASFPGKMYLFPLRFDEMPINNHILESAISTFSPFYSCQCQFYDYITLSIDFSEQDKFVFTSDDRYCDQYTLNGWIKVVDIIKIDQIFSYLFLKMCANSENPKITNQNLCAFQLFFDILNDNYKIRMTTYNYQKPLINQDFTLNQNLITHEFKINNIFSWIQLQLVLIQNDYTILLNFYEDTQTIQQKYTVKVNHFHLVQFKFIFGNVLSSQENLIKIKIYNFQFNNCFGYYIDNFCDPSCLTCDGPTKNDCLSCDINQNRIYLTDKKTCICPYGYIDNLTCQNFQNYNFEVDSIIPDASNKCKFGYFEIDQQCIQCPSIIQSHLITCLECVYNPNSWIQEPFCKNYLVLDAIGSPFQKKIEQEIYYFIFDGTHLNLFEDYEFIGNVQDNYNNFKLKSIYFKQFCQQTSPYYSQLRFQKQECYDCSGIKNCLKCKITLEGLICLQCESSITVLINGICQDIDNLGQFKNQYCLSPNYFNSRLGCSLCSIKYCIYCFEYLSDDLTFCTLYDDFTPFNINEYHSLGCALCEPQYIFDFTKGLCIKQSSQIENCSRSFINLNGVEICTLSSIQDFNIAPEIEFCQQKIPKCQQCILNPEQVIKCTLCEEGYSASITTGQCKICSISHVKICIEGNFNKMDAWVQLIQSFMMQFLPNKYFYPITAQRYLINQIALLCDDGYVKSYNGICIMDCDSNCKNCEQTYTDILYSTCSYCDLNYYNEQKRSTFNGVCLTCQQLCEVCIPRLDADLYKQNPYFTKSKDNEIFTYLCLKSVSNNLVTIDPYLHTAIYCLNDGCEYSLNFNVYLTCENFYFSNLLDFQEFYENQINIQYCNQMGIKFMKINFFIKIYPSLFQCFYDQQTNIITKLKNKIFTLQLVQLNIIGELDDGNVILDSLLIKNFDKIQFQNLRFKSTYSNFSLTFENELQIIQSLEFQNIQFQSFNEQFYFSIQANGVKIKSLKVVNLQIINMKIFNSIVFNLDSEVMVVENIEVINCTFENVILLKSLYQTNIQITQISVINSTFINSIILIFDQQISSTFEYQIDQIVIENNRFFNSTFFSNSIKYSLPQKFIILQNSQIIKNLFIDSQLIITNNNLSMFNFNFLSNQFVNSIFCNSSVVLQNDILILSFNNFNGFENSFSNSILIQAISNKNLKIYIVRFTLNKTQSSKNKQQYLFQIKCVQLYVKDFSMFHNFNIKIFHLYQTSEAEFDQVELSNSQNEFQIQFSQDCYLNTNYNSKFLQISGFTKLELKNFKIIKQYSFDSTLITVASDILFNQDILEIVQFQNFQIFGCTVLKKNVGSFISLIAIYSEKNQFIFFENMHFFQNSFHQYLDDPSLASPSLIYVGSLLSEVAFNQLLCEYNHLTNSTQSFIAIQSQTLIFQNFQIKNQNYFFDLSWKEIYNINKNISSDEIYIFITNVFIIKNIGGAFSIVSSNLTMMNGQFINISAQSSAVLEIKTSSLGIILLKHLIFDTISADLSQSFDLNGCINIYSKNSLLNLQLSQVEFNNVLNNLGSAILSIIPSQKKNLIQFNDVYLKNCLSLINLLTKIEFPENFNIINLVRMINITILTTLKAQITYFQQLNTVTLDSISKIKIDNAILNIKNCDLLIQNFFIEGYYYSPIFKFQDISNFLINQIQIISIQQFYPFNLLQIFQMKQSIRKTIISNLIIKNTKSIRINEDLQYAQIIKNFSYFFQQCDIHFLSLQTSYQKNQIISFIEQLNLEQNELFSLIHFFSSSQLLRIQIQNLKISKNICIQNQQNGFHFILNDFKKLQINEFFCNYNVFLKNGCIIFAAESFKIQQSMIIIQYSSFIFNTGGSGTGIASDNLNLRLINCKFIQNNSTEEGGAIYFKSKNEELNLMNTQVVNNLAKIGGGIYFKGKNHMTDKNFMNSILQFNFAKHIANNLNEQPRFLQLSINDNQMKQISINQKNNFISILQVQPYQTLQQGKKLFTDILYLPSGQTMKSYQIFNPQKQTYLNYISEITLSFHNSLGERLIYETNGICSIQQNIYFNQILDKIISFETIEFNQQTEKINLESYIIKYDPYNSKDKILQIEIQCLTDNNTNILTYQIQSQTLMCQLGEFYVDEGCQICQFNQGYYSVNYNVTKCSIFDKNKFKTITSNRIELLPGFWRPNQFSDFTEVCFKNTDYCQGGWGTGDQLCSLGHIGGLCEECDIYNTKGEGSYFKNYQNSNCISCVEFKTILFSFFLCLLWSFLSIILTLRSVEKSNGLYISLRLKSKFYKILFQLNQDHESILLKMLINYVWIFSVILTLNINFEIFFNIADSTANTIQFMINNLDCYLVNISQIQIIYGKVFFMILLITAQLLAINFFVLIIQKLRAKTFETNIISTTAIYLFVSNHASLTKNFCSLLSIRTISQFDFIQGNVSYKFNSISHKKWIFGFLLPGLGIWGLLIPILLFFFIYIQRNKLDQMKRRKHLCYLFNEYNQSSYFWEQIKIWQKTIIIIILTQFETNILLKVSFFGICLMLYQTLALKFKPYTIQNLNKIDVESGQKCTFAIFLAAIIHGSKIENKQLYYFYQILLMVVFILLCIPFLYNAFRVYYKKYKILFLSIIIKALKKIKVLSQAVNILDNKIKKWKQNEILLKNNTEKLKRYLLQISKSQIEQQKMMNSQNITSSVLKSKLISQQFETLQNLRDD